MSEQWWAVKVGKKYYDLCTDQKRAQAYASEWGENYLGVEAVPVRIVEDAEPCEWEKILICLHGPEDADEDETNLTYCKESGYDFCPSCGRSLKEE